MAVAPRHALRRATLDDLDAIMALESSTFGSDAWSHGAMRDELASPHGYYLVAEGEEGAGEAGAGEASADDASQHPLAGYAGLLAPLGSGQADIQTIAVAPDARRRGLGRMLMVAMLDEARARAATEVFLEVRADNPNARALYDSLGFEQIAVRPRYYQPDGVDAQIMRRGLTT
jgi:ribosomal-protein-alanine acetyltransferase